MDMLWCQGGQNIGLSNHLKCALKCTVWWQCTPVPDTQTDRRTDEHHSNNAMIRSNETLRAKVSTVPEKLRDASYYWKLFRRAKSLANQGRPINALYERIVLLHLYSTFLVFWFHAWYYCRFYTVIQKNRTPETFYYYFTKIALI